MGRLLAKAPWRTRSHRTSTGTPRWPFVVNENWPVSRGLTGVYWFGNGPGFDVQNLAPRPRTGNLVSGGGTATARPTFDTTGRLNTHFSDVRGTTEDGYSITRGPDFDSEPFSVHFIVMRANDTASSGAGRVQQVVVTRSLAESAGFEMNVGNFFGGDGDKNKARTGSFGSVSNVAFYVDGVKQASPVISDNDLVNGQFYHITFTASNIVTAGSSPQIFTQDNGANFNLDGGGVCIYFWDRTLSDKEAFSLHAPETRWNIFHELGRVFYSVPAVVAVGNPWYAYANQ